MATTPREVADAAAAAFAANPTDLALFATAQATALAAADRPCLLCGEGEDDEAHATGEHAYEPEDATEAEATAVVLAIAEEHGEAAAAEAAASWRLPAPARGWVLTDDEEAELAAALGADERASILADLADEDADHGE